PELAWPPTVFWIFLLCPIGMALWFFVLFLIARLNTPRFLVTASELKVGDRFKPHRRSWPRDKIAAIAVVWRPAGDSPIDRPVIELRETSGKRHIIAAQE